MGLKDDIGAVEAGCTFFGGSSVRVGCGDGIWSGGVGCGLEGSGLSNLCLGDVRFVVFAVTD